MSKKVTTSTFRKFKKNNEKITMLTAYDYSTAKIIDEAGIDAILVGDSLGMVILGYEDTTRVTMDDMVHHTKAVTNGAKRALVVADMPFLSYHMGKEESVKNAGRLIQEGHAQAVKLEGGLEIIEDVKSIIRAGIPVMGHLGLTPQSIHNLGGYFIQGKTSEQAKELIKDAKALEDAGVFSIVLECVPAEIAELVTSKVSVPTIGIGAGNACDGQILVSNDMLGTYKDKMPSFVKKYGEIGDHMEKAISQYISEVKDSTFPDKDHSFHVDPSIIKDLQDNNQN